MVSCSNMFWYSQAIKFIPTMFLKGRNDDLIFFYFKIDLQIWHLEFVSVLVLSSEPINNFKMFTVLRLLSHFQLQWETMLLITLSADKTVVMSFPHLSKVFSNTRQILLCCRMLFMSSNCMLNKPNKVWTKVSF